MEGGTLVCAGDTIYGHSLEDVGRRGKEAKSSRKVLSENVPYSTEGGGGGYY